MATRWQLTIAALCVLIAAALAHAEIHRWDTGEPGKLNCLLGAQTLRTSGSTH